MSKDNNINPGVIKFDPNGLIKGSAADVEFYRQHSCGMSVEDKDTKAIYTRPYFTPEGVDIEIQEVNKEIKEAESDLKSQDKTGLSQLDEKSRDLNYRLSMLKFLREQATKSRSNLQNYYDHLVKVDMPPLIKKVGESCDRSAKAHQKVADSMKTIKNALGSIFCMKSSEVRQAEAESQKCEQEANKKQAEFDNLLLKSKLVNLAIRYKIINKLK